MPVLAFLAFFRNPGPMLPAAWSDWRGRTVVLLAGALPALNFIGLWDDDLSAALYSGRTRQGFVLLTEEGLRRFPAGRPYVVRGRNRVGLDLVRWPLVELNVPPYPEPRVYRSVARSLAAAGVPLRR